MAGYSQLDGQPRLGGPVPVIYGPGRKWYAPYGRPITNEMLLRDRRRSLLRDGVLRGTASAREGPLPLPEPKGYAGWAEQPACRGVG